MTDLGTHTEPTLKDRGAGLVESAKSRLGDLRPQLDRAADKVSAARRQAVTAARSGAEPAAAFARKHRRVLTTVAIAAGAGLAAYLAFRRFPGARKQVRRLTGQVVHGVTSSGAMEAAVDKARDLGRTARDGFSKLRTRAGQLTH